MKSPFTQQEFANRRKKLFSLLPDNSIVFLNAGKEKVRNVDNFYPFRPDHNFYYLTGFNEPDAIAVLTKDKHGEKFILFNKPHNAVIEMWLGKFSGQDGAVNDFKADEAYDIEEFPKKLNDLLNTKEYLYSSWGRHPGFEKMLVKHVHDIQERARMGYTGPSHQQNIETILHEARVFKSEAEISALRYSAETAAKAHIAVMQSCRPDIYEYQLQAEFTHVIQAAGCTEYAYYPIFAAGNNACVLHYNKNNAKINENDLILVDAGCEYEMYASDITRSFPASGKFSPEQKALYETALNAQLAGLEMLKPGKTRHEFVNAVATEMTKGLVSLGLLEGQVNKLIEEKAFRKFYPHSPGHWLGLDTHDVGNYVSEGGETRELQAGMVTTNEPGIYIPIGTEGVDKKWWGIGVRIEDDILITENGHDNLSELAPKTIDEIEALMQL